MPDAEVEDVMDEAQADVFVAPPCEVCKAGENEPCEPGCPGFIDEGGPSAPLLVESQRALMADLHRLPFSAFIGSPPSYQDRDTDLWLAELATWMHKYREVLAIQVGDLQRQSRRLISLEIERDAVKNFFARTG